MNLGGTVTINKRGFALILCSCISVFFVYNFLKYEDKKIREELVDEAAGMYLQKKTLPPSKEKVNLKELLKYAIEATVRGGVQVRRVKDGKLSLNVVVKGKTKEGVIDPKTQADMLSHQVMTGVFEEREPGIKVVSEEHSEESLSVQDDPVSLEDIFKELSVVDNEVMSLKDVSVWIDPLDATKEYTENLTQYVTTMVCIAVKGEPMIGVVHYPFTKETYWGWVGKAHSNNLKKNKQMKTSSEKNFIVSISHAGDVKKIVDQAFPGSNVISAAGAGYKMIEVATRNASAYLHITDIKKWDTCAGHAIVLAVGGHVTTLVGGSINYTFNTDSVITDGLLATMDGHKEVFDNLTKACPKGVRMC